MKRRLIALVLVISLVASLSVTAFAGTGTKEDPIIYVSLGDSMTNGFGMDGYYPVWGKDIGYEYYGMSDYSNCWTLMHGYGYRSNSNVYGYMVEDSETYAKAFYEYLGTKVGAENVEWEQMAVSGMRPEDFYWLFQDVDGVHDGYEGDKRTDGTWKWGYGLGYDETANIDEYAKYQAANGIEGAQNYGIGRLVWAKYGQYCQHEQLRRKLKASDGKSYKVFDPEWVEAEMTAIKQEWVDKISSADYISVNLGTYGFASICTGRVMDALNGDTSGTYDERSTVAYFLRENPDMLAEYEALQEQYVPKMVEMLEGVKDEEFVATVLDVYTYALLSFMKTYDESIKLIRYMNPEAKIITFEMTNFLEDLILTAEDGTVLDCGAWFDLLVDFTNLYRSAAQSEGPNSIYVEMPDTLDFLFREVARDETNDTFLGRLIHAFASDKELIGEVGVELLGWRDDVAEKAIHKYGGNTNYQGLHNYRCLPAQTILRQYLPLDDTAREAFLNGKGAGYISDLYNTIHGKGAKKVTATLAALTTDDITAIIKQVGTLYDDLQVIAAQETFSLESVREFVTTEHEDGLDGVVQENQKLLGAGKIEEMTDAQRFSLHYWLRYNLASGVACHLTEAGHDQIYDAMIAAFEKPITGADYTKEKIEEILAEDYTLDDAAKVMLLEALLNKLDEAYLAANPKVAVLKDVYFALAEEDALTDKQTMDIIRLAYELFADDDELSNKETLEVAEYTYTVLMENEALKDEDRLDIVGKVYVILKTNGYLAGYEKEMALVEELVAHPAMEKVTAEQAFAIVDYIYDAVCDGDVDVREMLGYIYFEVLKAETPAAEAIALLAVGDPILSAADKLAIVEAVYEIMDKHYDLESTPNLKAIKDLYDVLTDDEGGEPLVSDELALSIIDLAVKALVENETLGEEEIAEVAAEIADKLLAEDSELTREAKAAVLREVTNALKSTDLGETEIGGAVLPALDVIDELRTELGAYLSNEQVGEIVEIVYSFVKENDTLSEKQKAQLADKIYTIVLNREELTAEDKIEILTIIYTVLDEHDYVDANVTIAYMKAYAAAKEQGYIDDAALALDAVKGIVELAKDYVDMYPGSEELKALLLEELDNTEETLDALIGLLDNKVLDKTAWAEMKALEDELNKHIETITELAEAMGVELDGCIADLEDAAKIYADMIAEVAEAAYDYAVESIEGFADDYAEWVESVGDEIDEVNPVLGDAVRKFLTEVPADALSILYAYGDEAVAKLVSEAVIAYGDMETVIADLAYVLNTYGEVIYEAVKGNDEIETLIEDIQDQLAEVKELVEWINDHPFEGAYNASVADKEAALQTAYDQLVYLYNRLYDVAMSVIADVDEDAAEALEAALDAMSEILSIAGESAEGYLGWLADHGEAMGCALLTALLDNIEELLTTACPIVDELIWALLAQVDQAVLEFLPVADQWMYDWLYNNPDKVIAFFTEYGEEIAELAEEYGEYVVGILGYIAYTYGPEVLEYVIENPEEALEQFVAWYDKYGYRVWPMIDVYLEELGVYDAIEDGAEAVIEKIEEALEELGVQLESEIRDLIDEKLDDATHGEYTVTADSYYVAIDEMYGEDEEGYADKLAEHLGIAYNEINELDEDEIAKADLITVRYNNEPMIGVMIEDAKDYKTVEAKDWSVYVGEVGAEYVQQALAEVKAMLAEQDLGTMSDMALVAVESYAYEYVGHMINYIQDLETISEINPDALVISVGMNNALADVVLTLDEEEIALGEYIQYVVDAANLEAFVYVLVTGNAIYVDAPAVETEFDAEESADVMDFILNLIDEESREVLLATDDGHEYIKEQILGALTITYEGLLGDANNDGVVDYVDAIYVLEYDAKLRAADELALHLCDVNGDGAVDYVDAIFILEYDAKLITKFPAAV